MGVPASAAHGAVVAGLATVIAVAIRHALDAVLRLFAGVIAILAADDRSRARRALDVLRLLGREREIRDAPEREMTEHAAGPAAAIASGVAWAEASPR